MMKYVCLYSMHSGIDESQHGYLHCIPEDHIDMLLLYERVEEIVAANQTGPTTYLFPIYTYYYPLISDRIKKMTEAIFVQETIPPLPVSQRYLVSSGVRGSSLVSVGRTPRMCHCATCPNAIYYSV